MATPKELLSLLFTQEGDPYVWEAEASPSDSNPNAFDCSELVEWGCARLGVKPTMPDGSWMQVQHCRKYGLLIEVDEAIRTPGALLFRFKGNPFTKTRPEEAHVAVSQGNGQTFEAKGEKYGVGAFSAAKESRKWTHAGLIPGLDYSTSGTPPLPTPTPPSPPTPPPTPPQPELEIHGKRYRVTAENRLNIRSGPGIEYEVWDELKHGEVVIIPNTAGWLPILLEDNSTGWVSQKFVEEVSKSLPPAPTPPPGPSLGGLTLDQLQEIVPYVSDQEGETLIQVLNRAMEEAEINTPLRQAAFIAQLAHESQGFSRFEENLNYRAARLLDVFGKYFDSLAQAQEYAHKPEQIANRVYANRLGNGDEDSGDGWRYRGRGFIQLTGRDNYRAAGNYLHENLADEPDKAAKDLSIAARVAAWFWTSRGLNRYADLGQFDTITKKINGGLNGLNDRRAYYKKAKEALGVA